MVAVSCFVLFFFLVLLVETINNDDEGGGIDKEKSFPFVIVILTAIAAVRTVGREFTNTRIDTKNTQPPSTRECHRPRRHEKVWDEAAICCGWDMGHPDKNTRQDLPATVIFLGPPFTGSANIAIANRCLFYVATR